MKILLDCGHCLKGGDTGASGCGYREENLTRQIGYELRDVLEDLGHNVVICSCDSANSLGESLAYRVNKANSEGGDIYVSIHLNAFNGEAYGAEVYTYGGNRFIEAERVLSNITKLGYTNRGIKDGSGLYIIRNTDMKAMLIECCFIDNEKDMERFNSTNMANAIVSGIVGETGHNEVVELSMDKDSYIFKELQHEINVQGFGDIAEDNIPGPITLSHCPMLRRGAQGNITRILQKLLGVDPDSIFGGDTERAVMQFQNSHGLVSDGIVGQNTWRALLGL